MIEIDYLIKYFLEYIDFNKKHECFQFELGIVEFQTLKDNEDYLKTELEKELGSIKIDLCNERMYNAQNRAYLRIDRRNKQTYKIVLPK